MLRLIGIVCVVVGFGAVGLQQVFWHRRQLEQGRALLAACRLMRRELNCREPDLAQLLEELAGQTGGTVGAFFAACRRDMRELGKRPFFSIWRENLGCEALCLGDRERELLAGLGAVLGRYDRESQCEALERVADELEVGLREARGEAQKRDKLYMTLSIAGGMLLAVLAC